MGPLHIFTPCFGDSFLDLFEGALSRSLRWPLNNVAIVGAKWTILSDCDGERAKSICRKVLPGCHVTVLTVPELAGPCDFGQISMAAVIHTAKTCIAEKSQFLMATPDFVFGDGTIANMLEVAKRKDSCVGMAHIRVLPEFMEVLPHTYLDNQELMARAFQFAHPTWTLSEVGVDPSMSYWGGISWRRLNDSTVAVTHRLISTFLVNFKQWDVEYFARPAGAKPTSFGKWDHGWNEYLIEQGRLRIIGSSDGAAMAEITKPDANLSPMMPANNADPDAFYLDLPHTRIQRQFTSIFRG